MLEAAQYTDNSFWTLTYRDGEVPCLPRTSPERLLTLCPRHLQGFLKRFRAALSPLKVRFFAVGEYGDQTLRPHYHVILFNYPSCSRLTGSRFNSEGRCCPACDLVQRVWPHGSIFGGSAEGEALQYVAGYTVKKMGKSYPGLDSRCPEFARMSLRPAIGLPAVPELADIALRFDMEKTHGDVPSAVRHGMKVLPLGRYLRGKLREQVGMAPTAPPSTLDALHESLRPVREAAFFNSSSFQAAVIDLNRGAVESVEAKARIRKKRGSL